MIAEVLEFLTRRLTDSLPQDPSEGPSRFAYAETTVDSVSFRDDAVSILLVRIEEETALRQPDPYARISAEGVHQKVAPEIRLNLWVLFVAGFKGEANYPQALHRLSHVIRYFHSHRVFNQENSADLNEEVSQLILELVTPSFSEQNEIWGALRSAYRPSGVGFRRLFLELVVRDTTQAEPIFASGRTNEVGVIVDGDGIRLPTEFFEPGADSVQQYQRHHDVINSESQVQIYEELTKNASGRFTTSFIHRDEPVKDNRLLPKGWSSEGPAPGILDESSPFLEATYPDGDAKEDQEYLNGSGSDVVRYQMHIPTGVDLENVAVEVKLFSQSIPPYYLRQRFTRAPDGPATQRLYYLTSHLNLEGTPIQDWKLEVASVRRVLVGR